MAGDRGFVVRLSADVPASAEAAWRELVKPADWWDGEHSFSGDAANLSLDPRPGGCFCEALPAAGAASKAAPRGGVEYMRVVYVERPRALRMVGALGPLQAEAVTGTMTVQLKPAGDDQGQDAQPGAGTHILWEYVVGGFLRAPPQAVAAAADRMLAGQLARLAGKLGGGTAPAAAGGAPAIGPDFLDQSSPTAGSTSPPPPPSSPPSSPDSAGPPDDGARRPVGGGR